MPDLQKTFFVEKALLKALSKRDHYEQYNEVIPYNRLIPETCLLLTDYGKYFQLYPNHKEIDLEVFLTQFSTNWHTKDIEPDKINFFKEALKNIWASDEADAVTSLIGLVNNQFIKDIENLGKLEFTPDQVNSIVEKYEHKRAEVLQEYDKDCFELEDIDLSTANPEDGIPYAYTELQNVLYGQVPGDVIICNAAYGIGKTAFLMTQMVHTFKWLHEVGDDRPILFFNSEGSAAQAFGRFLSNLYREQCQEGYIYIVQNQERIKEHFFKKYNKLFRIYRANGRGFQFIKDKVKKYGPCVVYIDMLKGACSSPKRSESETSSLELFTQQLRDLSSTTCPIWGTVQAGESAFYWDDKTQTKKHKMWVDSNDIYGSKTGIQGAASVILSMGMNDARPNTRYIQTTKVKADSNAKFVCEIEKKFSNYKEISGSIEDENS